jgi:hypothetical protein
MKKLRRILSATLITMAVVCRAGTPAAEDPLYQTVLALDAAVFDAFNKCSAPEQLQKHAGYFSPDVEFYHDTGGVTWSRDEMLVNTKKNVCGKFRRELVPGTFKVFPIKGFGAIAQGTHRFCQFTSETCEGLADFTIIWREQAGAWQVTRVLSYGHRAAAATP